MSVICETKTKTKVKVKTHSFSFSKDFTEALDEFSKQHKSVDRFEFKNAFSRWITKKEIGEQISNEINRLKEQKEFNGTIQNIYDKMFHSARYYFRKKNLKHTSKQDKTLDKDKNNQNNQTNQSDCKKEKLGHLSKVFTNLMDEHIKKYIMKFVEENKDNIQVKSSADPARAYEDFCLSHKSHFRSEIEIISKRTTTLDTKELVQKFKKAYKNRFYKIIN